MMTTPKARNGKIDLMRFVFSMIVVLHHSSYLVSEGTGLFLGGSFAVEFFFIVSGYLMMASIRKQPTECVQLGRETRKFIAKKYCGVCPDIFVAHIIGLIFVSIAKKTSIADLMTNTIYDALLIGMSGIRISALNGVLWYISSMLLCMAILYPFVRKYPDMMVNVVLPLVSLLILGYFCGNKTSPRGPSNWLGWTYKGNLRAMAELSIGICSYEVVRKIQSIEFKPIGRIILSVIENLCYIAIILYMYQENPSRKDYLYIAIFTIAIMLSFCHKGIDARIFDNKICAFLGKFSLSIYLSHAFYAGSLNLVLPEDFTNRQRLVAYFACSAVTGLFVMVVSDHLRKRAPRLKSALKKCFIASQ